MTAAISHGNCLCKKGPKVLQKGAKMLVDTGQTALLRLQAVLGLCREKRGTLIFGWVSKSTKVQSNRDKILKQLYRGFVCNCESCKASDCKPAHFQPKLLILQPFRQRLLTKSGTKWTKLLLHFSGNLGRVGVSPTPITQQEAPGPEEAITHCNR